MNIGMNNRIKWFIQGYYFSIVSIMFVILIILAVILYANSADWKILLTLGGGLISFVYFIQKQQLDEAKFINELFVQFNQRYACLNDRLSHIIENKEGFKELQSGEIDTLNRYFNLCGEEFLGWNRGTLVQIQLDGIGGRWFKYNLTLNGRRSSIGAYAEASETRCSGDVASCDGPRDRRKKHIQDG